MKSTIGLACAASLLLLVGCEGPYSFQGTVTDTKKVPVLGATVVLYEGRGSAPKQKTTTDTNGAFTISGIIGWPAKEGLLVSTKEGFSPATNVVRLPSHTTSRFIMERIGDK